MQNNFPLKPPTPPAFYKMQPAKDGSLLEPDYFEPYNAWVADQSKTNTGALLKAVDPVINSAIRAYAGPSAGSPTIRAEARKMAIEAMHQYDPTKAPLQSHLMTRLQRIRRIAAQQRQVIRVPEQVALDQMQTEAAFKELEDKLGRPPSDMELADYTGLSVKRIEYIRNSQRPTATSTITRTTDEGGAYDPSVKMLGESHDSWLEFVYDDLDETNQFIMERVLGMHGHEPHKPSEVAAMLKISPAAVSHRMAQIQAKLDKRDELDMM